MKRDLGAVAKLISGAVVLLFAPVIATAHPGHVETGLSASSAWVGFFHPLAGLDHVLAMVAVGIWAAQIGGRALWVIPGAFVGVMILGAGLALTGVPLPLVESGIIASVFALGLAIACGLRLPLWMAASLVGVFALFHGHAHGTELSAGGSALAFGGGFVAATALLHAAGMGIGVLTTRLASSSALRWAGGAIGVGGLTLLAGV